MTILKRSYEVVSYKEFRRMLDDWGDGKDEDVPQEQFLTYSEEEETYFVVDNTSNEFYVEETTDYDKAVLYLESGDNIL